jgi:hypothetical protein
VAALITQLNANVAIVTDEDLERLHIRGADDNEEGQRSDRH